MQERFIKNLFNNNKYDYGSFLEELYKIDQTEVERIVRELLNDKNIRESPGVRERRPGESVEDLYLKAETGRASQSGTPVSLLLLTFSMFASQMARKRNGRTAYFLDKVVEFGLESEVYLAGLPEEQQQPEAQLVQGQNHLNEPQETVAEVTQAPQLQLPRTRSLLRR